jgi:hypothetical protein
MHKNLVYKSDNIAVDKKLVFINQFKPDASTLFTLLRNKDKKIRQSALLSFYDNYAQTIENINELNIWVAGSVPNYKLAEIRQLCKTQNAKVVTRLSSKVNLVVVGEKTKLETLPQELKTISSLEFERLLNRLKEQPQTPPKQEENSTKIIALLLSNEAKQMESAFELLEKEGVSLQVIPLLLAIFKIHKEKPIRQRAKALLLNASSNSTTQKAMQFCEGRNFINAKYTVGMEELAKIKGFEIDLFLYYLVLHQKHHLGKEYLASLNSPWTQKLIEEQELLNQKTLTLYGKAGEKFLYAKKIEHFSVHAISLVLWKMAWLKSLEIIELKAPIELPTNAHFQNLESLTLESKEITLRGTLNITQLTLRKCKTLTIEESFKLPNIKSIKLESCSFELMRFKDFLEKEKLEKLESIEVSKFIAYKMPKKFEQRLKELLPEVKISFN